MNKLMGDNIESVQRNKVGDYTVTFKKPYKGSWWRRLIWRLRNGRYQ